MHIHAQIVSFFLLLNVISIGANICCRAYSKQMPILVLVSSFLIIALLYVCLFRCHSVVLFCCPSVVMSFCCSIVLPFYRSSFHHAVFLSFCWTVVLSFCWSVVLLFCPCVVPLFCPSVVLSFSLSILFHLNSSKVVLVSSLTGVFTKFFLSYKLRTTPGPWTIVPINAQSSNPETIEARACRGILN